MTPRPVEATGPYPSLLFGTTSYVLPADLLPNVRLLAPYVDDIELILFEGEASNLPSRAHVHEIGLMGSDGGCGFTIHLPLDVGIGEDDHVKRRDAQDTVLRVIDLTLPLEPHAFVVHPELPLRYHPAFGQDPEPLDSLPAGVYEAWQEHLGESLARFRIETGPFPLAVENLQFPFRWVRPLLDEHDLGVTFDVGHLLTHGGEVDRHLDEFGDRLTVVHLHGVDAGRDHREIGCFDPDDLLRVLGLLAGVRTGKPVHSARGLGTAVVTSGTEESPSPGASGGASPPVVVSLEVFGWKPTTASLRTLSALLGESRGGPFAAAADAVMQELPRWDPSAGARSS